MTPFRQRLLPSLLDEIAAADPGRILYSVPRTNYPKDGFVDIDAKTFARAVDRCAWYIEDTIGRGEGFPTLTYLGPQDIVYGILLLASVKTGYKLLLNSARNTLEAHLRLLEQTECNTFLHPPSYYPLSVVEKILSARKMRVVDIPGPEHWLEDGHALQYTCNKSFAEARLEPFTILHTSGSTGMPKPITQTHATVAAQDALASLPSLGLEPGFPAMCTGTRMYIAVPIIHCAGLLMFLSAIYAKYTVVLGPFPPSAEVINAVHVHGNVQHSVLSPASLVDLVENLEYLDNLTLLKQVTYGGGPLPKEIGEIVSTRTRLFAALGSTECGPIASVLNEPQDWAYLRNSPVLGDEFREISKGLYEHIIVRDPKYEAFQGVFGTFPACRNEGRVDDVIVFSTGEKLNPIDMENDINKNRSVSSALVTGVGRFQSGLLIEAVKPPTSDIDKNELLSIIWPSVEAANKQSPSHARIHRDMVIFTTTQKPMLRAGKGTVQRQLTIEMYADELNALYEASDETSSIFTDAATEDYLIDDAESTKKYADAKEFVSDGCNVSVALKNMIAQATEIDVNQISPDTNLFELGLDSLQVILIAKEIKKLLFDRGVRQKFEAKTLYSNPSISSHACAREPAPVALEGAVVLLTGSTGSLGSYVLDLLLRNIAIRHVYCLNRGPESGRRQKESQSAKKLQALADNVEFYTADLSRPYFGLAIKEYRILLREVTIVIHNAWQVDFNLNIDSFADHIGAVRRFIDFSTQSRYGAKITFVSSVSTLGGLLHNSAHGAPNLERMFDDWDAPEPTGYGQSKFIAERLLDTAAREAEVPAILLRVGQVASPTTDAGIWPKQEWLPSLIASSRFLGELPPSIGKVSAIDWIPVNDLSHSIVEIATSQSAAKLTEQGAVVYHVVNPRKTSWETLASIFQKYWASDKAVKMVSLETWVESLRKSASAFSVETTSQNPAVKLLDFFEGLVSDSAGPPVLNTRNAIEASPTLAGMDEIQTWHIENWMRQWGF
ncbi:hypothetical protein BKA67DRAFT_664833 [Truncatella angustata]|uniref:Carrier domain-containing protein n=1 Tax=Truncatella angustata TaxID=152316 RepID=A0A9P8RFP0_9PEZI|nr:uncharacterized protein BKA67DRAFT_664833 [Truncatella angustata]KAH6644984.1 hypothetical protein BKA67DRAFT_664833 [Truncatella angustata]